MFYFKLILSISLKELNLDHRTSTRVLSSTLKVFHTLWERPLKFMSFNKITIVGNLGRDPELRYTPQGTPVCSFTVATNERRKDRAGEMQDSTTWFRVTLWGRQAETASQYLTKGRPIYVEGRLRVEEWTDRDGRQRYTLEVHATDMQFIGGGRGDESAGTTQARSGGASEQPEAELSDDDIPF
jgi:single-strand DNA-binding protein